VRANCSQNTQGSTITCSSRFNSCNHIIAMNLMHASQGTTHHSIDVDGKEQKQKVMTIHLYLVLMR